MNKGLIATVIAIVKELPEDDKGEDQLSRDVLVEPEHPDNNYKLPLDIALMGYTHLDLKMLDKALHGPNLKEWQEALEYEIISWRS